MLYLLSQSHLMYKRSIFQNHMQPFFQFVFKYDLRIGEKKSQCYALIFIKLSNPSRLRYAELILNSNFVCYNSGVNTIFFCGEGGGLKIELNSRKFRLETNTRNYCCKFILRKILMLILFYVLTLLLGKCR